jgi:CBS domain-containing protein
VHHIGPTHSIVDAVDRMNEARVGALMVLDDQRPVGIISERDVLRRVIAARRDPLKTTVAEVMTRELIVVSPDIGIEDAMLVISEKRCRHLPILEDNQLKGMVSIGDLTHWLTRDREVQIQQLVGFITGKYPA